MFAAFDALDRNGDGVISRSEFSAAMAAPTIMQPAVSTAGYVTAAAPITTYSQGFSGYSQAPTTTVGRTYQPSFSYAQPAAAVATSVGRAYPSVASTVQPAATSLFNVIDANGDGKISQTEFSNYITGATSYIQQAPAVSSYVQPANSVTIAPQYQPATTTLSKASPTVIQQPSYNYVRPAASVATRPTVIQQPSYNCLQPAACSLFNVIDANGDGKISQTEFANYITGATNYVQPAASTANFVRPAATIATVAPAANYVTQPTTFSTVAPAANYVTQPTTFSTVAPAANYVTQPTTYIQPGATSVFNAIDTNHDGKISRSEFASFLGQTAPLATTYAPSPTMFRG